jgi:urease accessory protein
VLPATPPTHLARLTLMPEPIAMPVFAGSPAVLERSIGRVEVTFKRRGAVTTLAHLHQAGCGKARLPRPTTAAHAEAVLINLAGGLTGGDRLDWQVGWHDGAEATVSGQAAEKIYRARGNSTALIETRLDVAADATALWLPQETILFDRARLCRQNRFRVARGGRLLAVEATILGRHAMGETVTTGLFDESVAVHYADRPVLAERQRFRGRIADLLAHPAVGRGAAALVSLLYVGEAAASRLGAIREALGETPAAATAPDPNLVIVRWLAPSPTGLRNHLVTALFALTSALGLPPQLPRVWSC